MVVCGGLGEVRSSNAMGSTPGTANTNSEIRTSAKNGSHSAVTVVRMKASSS